MVIKKFFVGDTNNTFIQFFRYCFVGGLAFVVDYGLMTLLAEKCGINAIVASTISFVAGLAVNYILSTFWIFKNSKIKNRFAEFLAFALIGVIGLGINAAIIWFFQYVLAEQMILGSWISADRYYLIGKLVSTVIVFVWNFCGRKFILFDRNSNK
ncbi:MAG TPA: GtrA family protein [Clostridiales bacterium]|nr:GtrA family protein [Clostridiales bacterium]